MYYIYILQSLKTLEFYKGLTKNLEQRLKQHFLGKVQFTRDKKPLKLIHVDICKSLREARDTEKYFKSGYGREIVQELASQQSMGGW